MRPNSQIYQCVETFEPTSIQSKLFDISGPEVISVKDSNHKQFQINQQSFDLLDLLVPQGNNFDPQEQLHHSTGHPQSIQENTSTNQPSRSKSKRINSFPRRSKKMESGRGYASSTKFVSDMIKYSQNEGEYEDENEKYNCNVIEKPDFFRLVRTKYEPGIEPKRYRRIIRQVVAPQQGYVKPELPDALEKLLKEKFQSLGKKKWNFVNNLNQHELENKPKSLSKTTKGKRKDQFLLEQPCVKEEQMYKRRQLNNHHPLNATHYHPYPTASAPLQVQQHLGSNNMRTSFEAFSMPVDRTQRTSVTYHSHSYQPYGFEQPYPTNDNNLIYAEHVPYGNNFQGQLDFSPNVNSGLFETLDFEAPQGNSNNWKRRIDEQKQYEDLSKPLEVPVDHLNEHHAIETTTSDSYTRSYAKSA